MKRAVTSHFMLRASSPLTILTQCGFNIPHEYRRRLQYLTIRKTTRSFHTWEVKEFPNCAGMYQGTLSTIH